jgi:hypothetical protein
MRVSAVQWSSVSASDRGRDFADELMSDPEISTESSECSRRSEERVGLIQ